MKKILCLAIFLLALSFTSCVDLNNDENTDLLETQATEKDDSINPNNNGGEDPKGPA